MIGIDETQLWYDSLTSINSFIFTWNEAASIIYSNMTQKDPKHDIIFDFLP